MEFWGWIISGSVAGVCLTFLKQFILWCVKKCKAKKQTVVKKECATNESIVVLKQEMNDKFSGLEIGLRAMLLDRILYLGRSYLHESVVDADDRRRLIEMHRIYHTVLGGNGDADLIIRGVSDLQLK